MSILSEFNSVITTKATFKFLTTDQSLKWLQMCRESLFLVLFWALPLLLSEGSGAESIAD